MASSKPSHAAVFNPALLINHENSNESSERAQDDPWFARVFLGARLLDRDGFLDGVENYQDNDPEAAFDIEWANAQAAINSDDFDAVDFRAVSNVANDWFNDINQLSERPLRLIGSAGFTFGRSYVNSEAVTRSWSFQYRRFLVAGSLITIPQKDRDSIDQSVAALSVLADVAEGVGNIQELADVIEIDRLAELTEEAIRTKVISEELRDFYDLPSVQAFVEASIALGELIIGLEDYFDFDSLKAAFDGDLEDINLPDLRQYLRYQIPERIEAFVNFEGADVEEVSLSYAQDIKSITGLNVGITVKHLSVTTIDFSKLISDVSSSDLTNELYRKTGEMLNFDLGASYQWSDSLSLGLVVKNIISKDFETVSGGVVEYRPIAKLGLAYQYKALQLIADIDLTKTDPLGFDPDKQYLGLAAKWDVIDAISLRAGVRTNLEDNSKLPSVGVGFNIGKLNVDIAVAKSSINDEIGGAMELGFVF